MIRWTPAIRWTAVFALAGGLAGQAPAQQPLAGVEVRLVVGREAAWVDLRLDLDALLVGIRPSADIAMRVRAFERLREAGAATFGVIKKQQELREGCILEAMHCKQNTRVVGAPRGKRRQISDRSFITWPIGRRHTILV